MTPILYAERLVDLQDPLFVRLIDCVTKEDFEGFLERFGDLGGEVGSELGALALYAGQLREAAEFVLMPSAQGAVAAERVSNWVLDKTLLQPQLAFHEGRIQFVLIAPNLSAFLAMELAVAVDAGAHKKRCAHCHKFFLYGPLTGRRSHARYCSDRCRVAAMRARNLATGEAQ